MTPKDELRKELEELKIKRFRIHSSKQTDAYGELSDNEKALIEQEDEALAQVELSLVARIEA